MSVFIYTWLQADDRFIAMYAILCGVGQILQYHTYVQVQDTYSGTMPKARVYILLQSTHFMPVHQERLVERTD